MKPLDMNVKKMFENRGYKRERDNEWNCELNKGCVMPFYKCSLLLVVDYNTNCDNFNTSKLRKGCMYHLNIFLFIIIINY